MSDCYIGLMSGTSLDAVDAVVADFGVFPPRMVATHSLPIKPAVKKKVLSLCQPGENEIERMGQLDVELGVLFAQAALAVIAETELAPEAIRAIGSHGQTIRHEPNLPSPFTLQIGDPNVIAQQTGITTVADFRRRDVAVGGQGAPLAPAYHRWILHDRSGVVVNIGGMANVTLLPAEGGAVMGFDTGPGNVLIDGWMADWQGVPMDRDGAAARQGQIDPSLLNAFLSEPFFQQAPPKSTGREQFNRRWLEAHLNDFPGISPEDLAATVTELTAVTIADAVRDQVVDHALWICGGGAHNGYLQERIAHHLPDWSVAGSSAVGMDPDWVEAMAFAWLAYQTMEGRSGNLPAVTGADQSVILGGIYPATP